MKRLHKLRDLTFSCAAMFTTGLVLLALVAFSCGDSGMSFEEADQALDESINEIKTLITEDVPMWSENFSEIFGLPEDDETALSEPQLHVAKEQGGSTVWKVFLVLAVLLLAVVGVLSTVYYLCVWRGGRMHYEQHKDVSI